MARAGDIFSIPAQTQQLTFRILVEKSAAALEAGGIVVMPSDTLYGLFSRYGKSQIDRLHEIKNRPLDKPFLLVFPESYPLDEYVNVDALDPETKQMIFDLWPGRNTIVLPKNPNLQYPAGDSIAIRKPSKNDNAFFYETLNLFNKPLLAPSLNVHGGQPLSNLDDIRSFFGNVVDAVFFDPAFVPGAPSQIWDLTKKPFERLR